MCGTCIHYRSRAGKCFRKEPPEGEVYLVTGNPMPQFGLSCFDERYSILPWRCGKKGRFHE